MTTDLDALEALAKAATPGPRFPDSTAAAMGMNEGERATVFDAYEPNDRAYLASTGPSTVLALIAELRQERERADGLVAVNLDQRRVLSDVRAEHHGTAEVIGGLMIERDEARAALSRAEETIEKVRDIVTHDGAGQDWRIRRTLTEYGKQKEADRG